MCGHVCLESFGANRFFHARAMGKNNYYQTRVSILIFWCISNKAFILARSLLGFGEACFSSIAPAIISDLYAIDQNRSKYLACYYFTIPVGR